MLNNLKIRAAVNTKISVFLICDKAIIYLLLFNLHDCTLINKILKKKKYCFSKSESCCCDKCDAVVEVPARQDIVKKELYWLNCFKPRHYKDCRTKIKFY